MNTKEITHPLTVRADVRWRFRIFTLTFIIFGAVFTSYFSYKSREDIGQLRVESHIWTEGVPAEDVAVSGKVTTTKLLFHEYSLTVTYTDRAGKRRVGSLAFDTFCSTLDESAKQEVRYVAGDPSQFALSTAVAARAGRISSIVFLFLVGAGGMGVGFIALGLHLGSLLRTYTHCGRRSDIIAVTATQQIRLMRQGEHTQTRYKYIYASPAGTRIRREVTFPAACEPLFADESKREMIALLSPLAPRYPVVLRSDFYPFIDPAPGRNQI